MCYLYGISKCQVCLSCKLCAINPFRNKTFLKCYLKKEKKKRERDFFLLFSFAAIVMLKSKIGAVQKLLAEIFFMLF